MSLPRYTMTNPTPALTDEVLLEQIDRGSRVIDLGCGDGRLLEQLRTQQDCDVLGVELDAGAIIAAVHRGVPVIQNDLDDGLPDIPDGSFDVAVLSQTLQQVHDPKHVLVEMMRVARRALVVVPNFGYWRVRLAVIRQGRAPVTSALPYEWYNTPNLHVCSMRDIRELAEQLGFEVVREMPIIRGRHVSFGFAANLRADSALYVLQRPDDAGSSPSPVAATTSVPEPA